jgi:hypothetical protein
MHKFHLMLPQVLAGLETEAFRFRWDVAAGGTRTNSLFRGMERRSEERYCQVDGVGVYRNRYVPLIIEAEEAGAFCPSRLMGKVGVPDLCTHLIGSEPKATAIPLIKPVFLQIVNVAELPIKSCKRRQYELLESDVRNHATYHLISEYHLLAGSQKDFLSGEQGEEFRKLVRRVIADTESQDEVTL